MRINYETTYETDQLLIRHFLLDDAEMCMESWGKDVNLGKYIINYPMKEISQMKKFVRGMSEQINCWLLIEKKRNEIVGYITIDIPYEPLKVGEVGYIIGEKYQGNKYSYEALKCLLHVYFTDFDLDLIEAKYNSSNKASASILHRLGFKQEALLRDRRMNFLTGEKSDMVICSITKNEFEAQN